MSAAAGLYQSLVGFSLVSVSYTHLPSIQTRSGRDQSQPKFHNVNCRFCGAIHSVDWACIRAVSYTHLQQEADTKKAMADAAYEIQKEEQRKTIEVTLSLIHIYSNIWFAGSNVIYSLFNNCQHCRSAKEYTNFYAAVCIGCHASNF